MSSSVDMKNTEIIEDIIFCPKDSEGQSQTEQHWLHRMEESNSFY